MIRLLNGCLPVLLLAGASWSHADLVLQTTSQTGFAIAAPAELTRGSYSVDPPEGETQIVTNIPGTFIAGTDLNVVIGADRFYQEGIIGQGTIAANVEAGHIWNGHETLQHVTSFVHDAGPWDDPGTVNNQQVDLIDRHATWVGSLLGGRPVAANPSDWQRGIAYGTDLQSGAIATRWNGSAYSGNFSINATTLDAGYRGFFGAADVINSSWGGIDSAGVGFFAVLVDALASQNPTTSLVVAAGNGTISNTVTHPGSGYNAITVAALANDGANHYDSVAAFSSRGPQDWSGGGLSCSSCRSAVDIAAPGTDVTAAYYGGQTGGNNPTLPSSPSGVAGGPNFYTHALSGTSIASPITAGGAALLHSAAVNAPAMVGNLESQDARVIKAVLLNSADKIPGWTNGQELIGGVIETTRSLDFASGAGAMNLDVAFDQLVGHTTGVPGMNPGPQGPVGAVGWDLGDVVRGVDNTYTISTPLQAGTTLAVTLDWFRDRSETFLENGTVFDEAQADLNLLVRDLSNNALIAQSISQVNVVEHLYLTIPMTSIYQLEVQLNDFVFDNSGVRNRAAYGIAWRAVAIPEPSPMVLLGLLGLAAASAKWVRRRAS